MYTPLETAGPVEDVVVRGVVGSPIKSASSEKKIQENKSKF